MHIELKLSFGLKGFNQVLWIAVQSMSFVSSLACCHVSQSVITGRSRTLLTSALRIEQSLHARVIN